ADLVSAQQAPPPDAAALAAPIFEAKEPRRAAPKKRAKRATRPPRLKRTEPAQTEGDELKADAEAAHGLTGAWLREQRQRLDLSQSKLGQKLFVPQTELSRYERQDKPLPAKWLPILKRLGFLKKKPRTATIKRQLVELLGRVAPP